MQTLIQFWYSKRPPLKWFSFYLLLPLAWLYQAVVFLRQLLFKCGIKKSHKFPVPIIIVGNITLGGNGKTPLVIWLANFLKAHGYRPGIVSRGYQSQAPYYPYPVSLTNKVNEVGDEALLIVKKTVCPMVIAPDRIAAVRYLLDNYHSDVIISDDGLQHLTLARDVEIVVVDGQRRFGNGFCLPAGPLREPVKRLKAVDFIVVTDGICREGEYPQRLQALQFAQVSNGQQTKNAAFFKGKNLHAVAGIGNPERFFRTLSDLGLTFTKHVFPDHYQFTHADIDFGHESIVVMTEKDAVKCQAFADHRHWALTIESKINIDFGKKLLNKITSLHS